MIWPHRRSSAVAVVLAAAAVLSGPAPGPDGRLALAASPDLSVVTAARYDVQPSEHRIDVTVDLTATNNRVDTATVQYTYEQAFLAVQPEATALKLEAETGSPSVHVADREATHLLLRIEFGRRLAAGQSIRLRLTYELPDPGTPAEREFRIGTVSTLRLWALATSGTSGSTVSLSVPDGSTVGFVAGALDGPVPGANGRSVWTSKPIPDPLEFNVLVRVEQPPTYTESTREFEVDGRSTTLILRAWSDDPDWADRVGQILAVGIPRLEASIGLPWPIEGPLVVQEAFAPESGGVTGSFDPESGRIEVVYDGGPEIILHEAAHAWFNGGLLADRWANEGFAAFYAELVALDLGLPFEPAVVTPELRPARIPLNGWASGEAEPPPGADRSAVEAYGYAAATELAREIAKRLGGTPGLSRLWTRIAAAEAPYQPPGGPAEFLDGPPDWRGLLDLLEDDGATQVADLWLRRVVLPAQAPAIADRTDARRTYDDLLELAGEWKLPVVVREAMRSWQFDVAATQLGAARAVVDGRAELAGVAAAVGIVPADLRERFESATDLAAVASALDAAVAAAEAIGEAQAARPASLGLVEWFGLLGSPASTDLAAAVSAFEDGDAAAATELAQAAASAWREAPSVGRIRLIVLLSIVVVAVAAVVGVVASQRRGRTAG
ncbi:MAG TPA: hypothetical protein VFX65_00010 [Candidatus Limnocylindrales bacterium]|nr:hypothetical protein [Candidatus Limnocylindrales bacterium]